MKNKIRLYRVVHDPEYYGFRTERLFYAPLASRARGLLWRHITNPPDDYRFPYNDREWSDFVRDKGMLEFCKGCRAWQDELNQFNEPVVNKKEDWYWVEPVVRCGQQHAVIRNCVSGEPVKTGNDIILFLDEKNARSYAKSKGMMIV
jgi:hypothetical protein